MKICIECGELKKLEDYYNHPKTADKHLGKCKKCCIEDNKIGNWKCKCKICKKIFYTTKGELTSRNGKRGTGRKTCSRECWYKWNKEENLYNWKGQEASYIAIHKWVYNNLGEPKVCEFCKKEFSSNHKIHWANKSGKYKRELSDWLRLCVCCHNKYDLEKRKTFKINCLTCGKEIETKSKKRRFCNKHCIGKYYRKNKKIIY
jgi:hypothetical protein